MNSRIYGYARVSSEDQNEDRQVDALRKFGVPERNIKVEKASGVGFNRPKYKALKEFMEEGDMLVITSIDRLGRNYREIVNEWNDITHNIKADIKVLDMPLLDTTVNKDLLGSFISDLALQILSFVAEQERKLIRQRQMEGIAVAREKGTHMGRPILKKPRDFDDVYDSWKRKEITAKKAMETLSLKRSSFYKLVKIKEGRYADKAASNET